MGALGLTWRTPSKIPRRLNSYLGTPPAIEVNETQMSRVCPQRSTYATSETGLRLTGPNPAPSAG